MKKDAYINVRVTAHLHAAVEQAAARENVPLSHVIRKALAQAVEDDRSRPALGLN
ncbi:putative DNA binding CopG/RHH family protein [Angulomicrobium tetraedrale]|uniref:Putative DNA binding CopG/RHH family protein n=1 Tax=Ancylobacter tetraedralis TaxID=217068 RepID=A0A839Z791_9HYPH|nr:hypothetical protein [Ancylobacter tetraedralis]MBB3770973.1 putative DNA binding CopG/RHH family protein [Ancylobacter tetraedralis]